MANRCLKDLVYKMIFVVLLFIGIGGCQQVGKYEWLPSESAPKNYPIEIVKGELQLIDGNSVSIPTGKIVNNEWGEGYSTHIVGEHVKAMPVRLDITWFSYTEDRFYAGSFALPNDFISDYFKEGINNGHSGIKTNYGQIVVGMLPGGHVSIWLSGEGKVIEVATFTADVAEVPWEYVLNDAEVSRETYIKKSLEDAMSPEQLIYHEKNGTTDDAWELYQKQYFWRIELASDSAKFLSLRLNTFNGESEFFDYSQKNISRDQRGLPKRAIIRWVDDSGDAYKTDISFNEKEIFAAYEKLSENENNQAMRLEVEIAGGTGTVNIALSNDRFYLPLEMCDIKLF